MSNEIPNCRTGHKVFINSVPGGMLQVDDAIMKFSDFLPILLHYISGGLMGFPVESEKPCMGFGLPDEELTAIRDFIKEVKTLVEVRDKIFGNLRFFPEGSLEANKGFVQKKD